MKGNQKNAEIRAAITAARLRQWEVAALLGISENTLVRWLRYELPEEKRRLILNAIESEVKRRERND